MHKKYWAGFVNGKLDWTWDFVLGEVKSIYGSKKECMKLYKDVRPVWITFEEPEKPSEWAGYNKTKKVRS